MGKCRFNCYFSRKYRQKYPFGQITVFSFHFSGICFLSLHSLASGTVHRIHRTETSRPKALSEIDINVKKSANTRMRDDHCSNNANNILYNTNNQ